MSAPSPKSLISYEEFSARFKREALTQKGFDPDSKYVNRALAYARPLIDRGLPVIFSAAHLAALVGYSEEYIAGVAASPDHYYRKFSIKKRLGGLREIAEPLPSLREIQTWIYREVLLRVSVSPAAKGFVPGKSLKDSARFHIGQDFVVRVDIKDFFPTINRRRVFGLFRSFGYSSEVAALLSRLCCLGEALPQGGSTSPYISNLILRRLDSRLLAFCKKKGFRYTRYADDLTISGKYFSHFLLSFISKVVSEEGFTVNNEKTSVMRSGSRQTVVGAVVNKRPNAPREYRRMLRQHGYFVKKYGLDDHLSKLGEQRSGARAYYLGKASFVLMLNPIDRDAVALREVLKGRP